MKLSRLHIDWSVLGLSVLNRTLFDPVAKFDDSNSAIIHEVPSLGFYISDSNALYLPNECTDIYQIRKIFLNNIDDLYAS